MSEKYNSVMLIFLYSLYLVKYYPSTNYSPLLSGSTGEPLMDPPKKGHSNNDLSTMNKSEFLKPSSPQFKPPEEDNLSIKGKMLELTLVPKCPTSFHCKPFINTLFFHLYVESIDKLHARYPTLFEHHICTLGVSKYLSFEINTKT